MPIVLQSGPLKLFQGWRDDPIFQEYKCKTSISITKEYWILLRSAADVYSEGKTLFAKHGITINVRKPWSAFRAYIHQSEHYWMAGSNTAPESAGLLYYYCFMNLVKALLVLKGIPMTGTNETHGLTTKGNTWKGSLRTKKVFIPSPRPGGVSLFSEYYNQVFSLNPPTNSLPIWKLLSYANDIGVQYQAVARTHGANHNFMHRYVIDNQQAKCWIILAIPKIAPISKNWTCFNNFKREFQLVQINPSASELMKKVFEFKSLAWVHYNFFQTLPNKELPITNNQFPMVQLQQKFQSTFGLALGRSYEDEETSAIISPPIRGSAMVPMNEEISIYATMYFVSELLRYHSDYLEAVLNTNYGWILKSFVESCPQKFLRIIISRIFGVTIKMSYF